MKMIARWMLAVALAVAVGGTALAQPPMQPGQGGRPGAGGGLQIGTVLTNKDLQTELKVTEDQLGKFKDVAAKLKDVAAKMAELRSGGQPDRTKMQEVTKEMTTINEEIKKVSDEVMTTDQKKRFKQIQIQAMGLRAFSDADVVKELKITDEEKKTLKEINDAYTKERGELAKELGVPVPGGMGGGGRPMGGGTPPDAEKMAEFAKKSKPMTDAAMEKSVKAMTADQQKQWTEMIGMIVDTTKFTARPMRMAN